MSQNLVKNIKHYCIRRLIGENSQCQTFIAWDGLNKKEVVIKYISKSRSAEIGFRSSGVGSIRTISSFGLDRIPAILDSGNDQGHLYFVRDFQPGTNLAEITSLTTGRINRFLSLATSIAKALDELHKNQLPHGNLSPENIIVTERRDVFLVDYSLNQEIKPKTFNESELADESYQYFSPEFIDGHDDSRVSDMYALGAIFYRVLTGQLPFGEGPVGELFERIDKGEANFDLLRQKQVPGDVLLMIRKLMSTNPVDRFQSAGELLLSLKEMTYQANLTDVGPNPYEGNPRFKIYLYSSMALIVTVLLWILIVHDIRH